MEEDTQRIIICNNLKHIHKALTHYQSGVRGMYHKATEIKAKIRYKKSDWVKTTGLVDEWQVVVQNELNMARALRVNITVLEEKIRNAKKAIKALMRTLSQYDKAKYL